MSWHPLSIMTDPPADEFDRAVERHMREFGSEMGASQREPGASFAGSSRRVVSRIESPSVARLAGVSHAGSAQKPQ